MGRRPAPPFLVRYTQLQAIAAMQLEPGTTQEQFRDLAGAAGIRLRAKDTLSEAQIRAISDYLDTQMVDLEAARFHAATAAVHRANPPKTKRGRLDAKAGLARMRERQGVAEAGKNSHGRGESNG
jgi:hypothetical protein